MSSKPNRIGKLFKFQEKHVFSDHCPSQILIFNVFIHRKSDFANHSERKNYNKKRILLVFSSTLSPWKNKIIHKVSKMTQIGTFLKNWLCKPTQQNAGQFSYFLRFSKKRILSIYEEQSAKKTKKHVFFFQKLNLKCQDENELRYSVVGVGLFYLPNLASGHFLDLFLSHSPLIETFCRSKQLSDRWLRASRRYTNTHHF